MADRAPILGAGTSKTSAIIDFNDFMNKKRRLKTEPLRGFYCFISAKLEGYFTPTLQKFENAVDPRRQE